MKLHFTNEWLRRKISISPDVDLEVDSSFAPIVDEQSEQPVSDNQVHVSDRVVTQLRMGLGVFVRQLRLRAGLSIAKLAELAKVPEDELRQVEHNPQFTARPYLIFKLSKFFDVPLESLAKVAGLTREVDRNLYNQVVKYAARSDDMSTLSREERDALDTFVSMLHDMAKDGR